MSSKVRELPLARSARLLMLATASLWLAPLAGASDLDTREQEIRARMEVLQQELATLEEELRSLENERSKAMIADDTLRLEHTGLCMRDTNTVSAEEPCTLGAPGVYTILKYDPDTSLSQVVAPDGRVGFAGVGAVDFKDWQARQRFEEMSTERSRRQEAEARARAAEQAERWEANRRAKQAQEEAARKAAEKQREKDLRTRYTDPSLADAIVSRKVRLGMTPGMVRDSWGQPDDINRTILPGVTKEQWVYGLKSFVYFECRDGSCVVTAIQN